MCPPCTHARPQRWVGQPVSNHSITPPVFKMACKQNLDLRCVLISDPSTLGAGAKTRLASRIKTFTPHCVCRPATTATTHTRIGDILHAGAANRAHARIGDVLHTFQDTVLLVDQSRLCCWQSSRRYTRPCNSGAATTDPQGRRIANPPR